MLLLDRYLSRPAILPGDDTFTTLRVIISLVWHRDSIWDRQVCQDMRVHYSLFIGFLPLVYNNIALGY